MNKVRAGNVAQWKTTCPACTRPQILSPAPQKGGGRQDPEMSSLAQAYKTCRIGKCMALHASRRSHSHWRDKARLDNNSRKPIRVQPWRPAVLEVFLLQRDLWWKKQGLGLNSAVRKYVGVQLVKTSKKIRAWCPVIVAYASLRKRWSSECLAWSEGSYGWWYPWSLL